MTQLDDTEFERTIVVGMKPARDLAPAADTIGHYLVLVEGADPGRRVEIAGTPVTIGRDPQQTLVFSDPELSRRHARVLLVNDEPIVQDLGSTNGTFVDGERIVVPTPLRESHVLRIGSQYFRYERRSRRDVERAAELKRDLDKASAYVFSLLPAPLTTGPVRTEWCLVPSTELGGDSFGYQWLTPETFAFYLIDVSGHGVGAAMHSVAVLNVLRQRALPGVDFANPAQVLASLNDRFQMDSHDGMYFTMWYGVYRTTDRSLAYSTAGHHPAYVVGSDRSSAVPIGASALMIGAIPEVAYDVYATTLPPESTVYLFSDGVFEVATRDQQLWNLSDFEPLLLAPPVAGTPEPERLFKAVKQVARPGPFDDDFSLMALSFQ